MPAEARAAGARVARDVLVATGDPDRAAVGRDDRLGAGLREAGRGADAVGSAGLGAGGRRGDGPGLVAADVVAAALARRGVRVRALGQREPHPMAGHILGGRDLLAGAALAGRAGAADVPAAAAVAVVELGQDTGSAALDVGGAAVAHAQAAVEVELAGLARAAHHALAGRGAEAAPVGVRGRLLARAAGDVALGLGRRRAGHRVQGGVVDAGLVRPAAAIVQAAGIAPGGQGLEQVVGADVALVVGGPPAPLARDALGGAVAAAEEAVGIGGVVADGEDRLGARGAEGAVGAARGGEGETKDKQTASHRVHALLQVLAQFLGWDIVGSGHSTCL